MQRKSILVCMVALLLSSLLAACGGGKGDGTKVRVGEVTRSMFYAPAYVALSQGFFKDEGLDIEWIPTPGGDKTMTALLSGAVDVALVGSETSIYVHQQGSDDPVMNFAQVTQTDGTFLVARKPMPNFTWSQLKGSVFLGQRKGGMPQMAGEYALKRHGIHPQNDLTLIQNVEFANIASAYASGTGEFVQLFEPQASVFEKEGKGYVLASFGIESGRLPYTVFMAKKSYMTKHPAMIQKFTNAIYRAQQWVQEKSVSEITEAVLPYFPDTDKGIAESVVKRYKEQQSYASDPIIDEEEWNRLLDVMEAAGELNGRVPVTKLVDNSFAQKAMEPKK